MSFCERHLCTTLYSLIVTIRSIILAVYAFSYLLDAGAFFMEFLRKEGLIDADITIGAMSLCKTGSQTLVPMILSAIAVTVQTIQHLRYHRRSSVCLPCNAGKKCRRDDRFGLSSAPIHIVFIAQVGRRTIPFGRNSLV